MRKITYWDIYGVKRFPYRGSRKYTPLLYQSLDMLEGGMIISNDVFGLTISQFERMFKACLDRRKIHEQYITNIRYPDKSSNEYIEYLENCTDCNTDQLLWLEHEGKEKYFYECLVNEIGTEIDIRKRQRLFIIQDMIYNEIMPQKRRIASGSLSEGLDLPGSDFDIMYEMIDIDVIHNVRKIKHPIHRTTCVMENDINHPGFTRLRLVAEKDGKSFLTPCARCKSVNESLFVSSSGKGLYLSVNRFLRKIWHSFSFTKFMPLFLHGPCFSDDRQNYDYAYCLRSKYLPRNAIPWGTRHRCQWPPNSVIDRIIDNGCLLVPIGPKTTSDNDLLWRLSFSVAEKMLVHSFNFTQLLCYGLLKLMLKRIVSTQDEVKDLLCSYFLKTALFWVSEEVDIDTFQISELYQFFSLCLDKLISWVNTCTCPNYFIPEHNMFLGKINCSNNKILICVLESIKCRGIDGFIQNLFQFDNQNHRLLSTQFESSFIMLDILSYRFVEGMPLPAHIEFYYNGLAMTESLIKSESSEFIIGLCKLYNAKIKQLAAQLLPSPNTMVKPYNIRKCYHQHYQDGTKTDAVSGWLLYASFYYVTGNFNVTLNITDYVLSRCSPDMVCIGYGHTCELHVNSYRHNVSSEVTFIDRMKIAVVNNVMYLQHSSLIPEELKLEVEDEFTIIPPVVMSHCLRFLCYHHLGDIYNKEHALHDLDLTVREQYLIEDDLFSCSITILGVCFEISGAKDKAYHCYKEALLCNDILSRTAEQRKSKLEANTRET
ncbi:uncharacterized protein [Mytilus edulis]|uniref:uncharacterized protein n=1 Tax=Mytilus edulis TaxID=6550 RepID=UPI0039F06E7A